MTTAVEEIITRLDQLQPEEVSELEQELGKRAKPGQESVRLVRDVPPTLGQRAARVTRKTLVRILLAVIILGSAVAWLYFFWTRTLAAEARRDRAQVGISYKVEQFRYRPRARIVFGDINDRQLICDLAPLRIQGVAEQRWLGNDRAIYLSLLVNSLEAVRANGRPETESAKLVYDFQRGELFVFSSAPLWRSPSGEERWLNEEEFNAVLARYQ